MQIKRSNKPDLITKLILGLNILSWLAFVAALIMFHYARPEIEYGIVKYFSLEVREAWLAQPKNILMSLLYACAGLSFVGMILGRIRSRRQSDNQRYNLILLLLVSLGLILVLIL